MVYKDLFYVYITQGIAGLVNCDKKEYAALPKITQKTSQLKGNIFLQQNCKAVICKTYLIAE